MKNKKNKHLQMYSKTTTNILIKEFMAMPDADLLWHFITLPPTCVRSVFENEEFTHHIATLCLKNQVRIAKLTKQYRSFSKAIKQDNR